MNATVRCKLISAVNKRLSMMQFVIFIRSKTTFRGFSGPFVVKMVSGESGQRISHHFSSIVL